MNKRVKKGFTIVELVIVIAVIAILAAVLIPVFSGMIKTARTSADIQLVSNLNLAVAMEKGFDGIEKYPTAHDAVLACVREGYIADRIVAKSDYDIAWSRLSGDFVLVDTESGKIVYPKQDDIEEYTIGSSSEESAVDYFIMRAELPKEGASDFAYSVYAREDWKGGEKVTYDKGFDAGARTDIKQVEYIRTGEGSQDVVIRTNSFETLLVVYAPNDTLNHYGFAYIADIQKIAPASFHEFGTVGRLKVADGHAVVENGGIVFCAMETAETANIENNNGKIYTETTKNANNGNENVTQKENGVFKAAYLDCGYGHHNMQKLVVDSAHAYEVCTACGYTVKVAGNDNGTSVYHTSDNKDATVTDPVVTINDSTVTIANVNSAKPIILFDINEDMDVEKIQSCEHEFEEIDCTATCTLAGTCTYRCSKCGFEYIEACDTIPHTYVSGTNTTVNWQGLTDANTVSLMITIKCSICNSKGKNIQVKMAGKDIYEYPGADNKVHFDGIKRIDIPATEESNAFYYYKAELPEAWGGTYESEHIEIPNTKLQAKEFEVNGTSYTFDEAFGPSPYYLPTSQASKVYEKMVAGNDVTIKLLKDVEYNSLVELNTGSQYSGTITLDLNGHTWTVGGTTGNNYAMKFNNINKVKVYNGTIIVPENRKGIYFENVNELELSYVTITCQTTSGTAVQVQKVGSNGTTVKFTGNVALTGGSGKTGINAVSYAFYVNTPVSTGTDTWKFSSNPQ